MSRMTEWITDRRPLPVDADEDGDVLVNCHPDRRDYQCAFVHHSHVGIGTPWSHVCGWAFPQIRLGQTWRTAHGAEARVKTRNVNDDNYPFLIVTNGDLSIWYNNQGLPALGWGEGFRLAELISEAPEPAPAPAPAQIPEAFRTGAAPFYVLVVADDGGKQSGEPLVWEYQFPAGTSLEAVLEQRQRLNGRYGTSYVAECRIIPALTQPLPNA